MPLTPVAQAAVADPSLRAVHFAMKDGCKLITVLVSNPALEDTEIAPLDRDRYFRTFKAYRKSFERIASKKYEKGCVELDGTVCIRAVDVPLEDKLAHAAHPVVKRRNHEWDALCRI